MTVLDITTKGTDEVLIDPPVPLPSGKAGDVWNTFSLEFLIYAFAGRAACIIADNYRTSDQGYLEHVERRDEMTVDGVLYQLGFSEKCSPDALARIVGTSDIWWDAVWIAGFSEHDERRIMRVVRALMDAHRLKISKVETEEELLASTGDGCGFRWVNPGKPIDEIVTTLTQLAHGIGWNVSRKS